VILNRLPGIIPPPDMWDAAEIPPGQSLPKYFLCQNLQQGDSSDSSHDPTARQQLAASCNCQTAGGSPHSCVVANNFRLSASCWRSRMALVLKSLQSGAELPIATNQKIYARPAALNGLEK